MSDNTKVFTKESFDNLVENEKLYRCLENTISQMYCEIHAIYIPDGSIVNGECFCAAADLFKPGLTFKIYFKVTEEGIDIVDISRWYFG